MALWHDFTIDDNNDEQVRLNIEPDNNDDDDEETVHFENIALNSNNHRDEGYSKLDSKTKKHSKKNHITTTATIGVSIVKATIEQKRMIRSLSCILLTLVLVGIISWTTETKLHRNDNNNLKPEAPLSISKVCIEKSIVESSSSLSTCKDLCIPHSCCWDSETYNNEVKCTNQSRKDCTLYKPCEILLKHRKPKIKPPPDNINELCALTDVKGEDNEKVLIDIHDECLNACLPGECCLETSVEAECFSSNEDVCALYETPCSHIPPSGFISDYGGKLPPIPNSLPLACAPNQSNDELIELCTSFCADALCCVGGGNLANCVAEDTIVECQEYKTYCLDVWPDENSIQIPNTAIDTLCSAENIKTKYGMDECHRICFLGSCCWENNERGNCYTGNEFICDKYSPCKDLFHDNVMVTPTVPMPKSDLETMCGSNALVSFPVLQSCIQECALGSCCFGYGHTNCASDNSDACLKYEPCENLPLFNQPQNSPMSPLEVICSPNMLQTVEGFATCSMVCEPGTCCNDDPPNSCYAEHSDACEEYEPCRSIKIVPPPPKDLYDKCSSESFANEELLMECEEACRPSTCCWEEGYGNCKANNPDICSQYNLCIDIPEVEHDLSSIAKSCSPESLGTKVGRKQCLNDCQEAWCCISEGDGNCVDDKPDFCFEYVPFCKDILLNAQFNVDNIDDPLMITCAKQNIVTKSGRADCEKECSLAVCCIAEGASFNCYNKDPEWCDSRSKICNILDGSSWRTPEHEQIPYASSNIIELCSTDSLSTFSGRRDCEEVCEPSSCCWEEIMNRNCRKQNEEACASYSICEKLLH